MGLSAPMGWIKLDLILRRLSCWSPGCFNCLHNHRYEPLCATPLTHLAYAAPMSISRTEPKKSNFLEIQVLPGHREVHWQSPCEKRQKFVRSKVRQHIWANITQCAEAIKLSGGSMNSSLSGDEKTAPWRHQTLGTGPLTVISGPWPSFPTVALVS